MEFDPRKLRLAKVEAEPVREVVDALEELLAQARAGNVRSLVAAWETGRPYETNSVSVWKDASVQMLVGELERMRLLLAMKLVGAIDVDEPGDDAG